MKNDEVKSANANLQASAISTIVLGFAADPMARWARTPSRSAIERYFKSPAGGRSIVEHLRQWALKAELRSVSAKAGN